MQKRLQIYVYPDCQIRLIVPKDTSESDILVAVQKRRRWIVKQLAYFRQQQQDITPRQYISGESHYYLGRQYVLKVIENPQLPQGVKFFSWQVRGLCGRKKRRQRKKTIRKLVSSKSNHSLSATF